MYRTTQIVRFGCCGRSDLIVQMESTIIYFFGPDSDNFIGWSLLLYLPYLLGMLNVFVACLLERFIKVALHKHAVIAGIRRIIESFWF